MEASSGDTLAGRRIAANSIKCICAVAVPYIHITCFDDTIAAALLLGVVLAVSLPSFAAASLAIAICFAVLLEPLAVMAPRVTQHAAEHYLLLLALLAGVAFLRKKLTIVDVESEQRTLKNFRIIDSISTAFVVLASAAFVALFFESRPMGTYLAWTILLSLCGYSLRRTLPAKRPICKERLLTYSLLAFSLLVAMSIVELGVRLVLPPIEGEKTVYRSHPKSLFLHEPNTKFTHSFSVSPTETGEVEITISSQGFRDRFFPKKADDEYRIAVVGDSFTLGFSTPLRDSMPKIIERVLNEENLSKNVSVINAGLAGSSQWQQLYVLREQVIPLEPDLVVLQYYPENDIGGCLAAVGKVLRSYNPELQRDLLMSRNESTLPFRVERYVLKKSRTYSYVHRLTKHKKWIARTILDFRFAPNFGIRLLPSNDGPQFFIEASLEQWYPDLFEGMELMRGFTKEIKQECDERGIALVAHCIPQWQEMDDHGWKAAVGEKAEEYVRHKPLRVVEEMLVAEGITHFSILDDLSRYSAEETYYIYDGHLSEFGNRVVAERICQYLLEEFFPNQTPELLSTLGDKGT